MNLLPYVASTSGSEPRTKILILLGCVACMVNLGLAQGTLTATLLPTAEGTPSLAASVLVYTPLTNSDDSLFPVTFEITVSATDLIFSVGRVVGGSTAWAFDLPLPTTIDGRAFYTATTEMGAFQIDDMLANRTVCEIISYSLPRPAIIRLEGPLTAVPEPRVGLALISVLALVGLLKARPTRLL